ncbi:MAG: tyrosine-type recombinase/integrase [Pseudomonadales bacterium]|nr:tyrosine-type recombinase/integrase [Pseudomonadales bacterium]MCP5303525.1 tyrosine-type recombinase/integrase [Pseudomonadales bacterium]
MSKRTPGLVKRGKNGIWTIDKRIRGYGRLFESTGTGDRQEAERYLTFRLEQIRNEMVYGVKPDYTFRQAATKYLLENERKRSIDRDAQSLRILDSFIGNLALRQVHQDTLGPFIASRKKEGLKSNTINRDLAVVRRVLILAARLWRDERGNPWLETTPLIRMLDWKDARKPYPISWVEQERLFAELPIHLREMALFKVNTGTREAEVCGLRWEWEVSLPELSASVFLIPGDLVKNGEDRLVVLNSVARAVVNRQRGKHREHVFTYTYKGEHKPVERMNTKAWRRARDVTELSQVRVHDLKHTFGRRLRAAGIGVETRMVMLGHTNKQITTHYSAVEIGELIEAAERVSFERGSTPTLTLLRSPNAETKGESRKSHAFGRNKKGYTYVTL